jgi:hypothetical protein
MAHCGGCLILCDQLAFGIFSICLPCEANACFVIQIPTSPPADADTLNIRFPIQEKQPRFHNPFQRIDPTLAVLARCKPKPETGV